MSDTPAQRRATISDIADLAGVSKGTVSKAFNNRGGVSESTRRRVLVIADGLGWRPSARAVALSEGGSRVLGFIVNRDAEFLATDPYFAELHSGLIAGIERVLTEYDYALLRQIASSSTTAEQRSAYATLAQTQRVDGVFLAESRVSDPRFDIVREFDLPALVIGRPWGDDDGIAWEGSPSPGAGISSGVDHLAGLGHRRVAYVSARPDRAHVRYRTEAFVAATQRHGMEIVEITETDFSAEQGYQATRRLLDRAGRPTAILYDNDQMAIAGCRAIRSAGLDVPGDVSIVGHDDILISRWVSPALTTIHHDVQTLGERCAHRMLSMLGVDVAPATTMRDYALVVRDSTGPAPRS